VSPRLRRAAGLGALLALVAGFLFAPARFHWMVDPSNSLPPGLYEIGPIDRPVVTGDLVVACPLGPALDLAVKRGYIGRGDCPGGAAPLLKLVAGRGGDLVDDEPGYLAIGGTCLKPGATFAHDSRGLPLPHAAFGARRLDRDQLWLWAPHPRSLDSRYYGPVTVAQLRGFARPVIVQQAELIVIGHAPCPRRAPT
jgi:conjugative transfer signal peptidase TraF